MTDVIWNPWHGCRKYSEGCQNCYVYRRDESIGRDASVVTRNASFGLPVKRRRGGEFKIQPGSTVFCCMTSDFFLEEADIWRPEIWDIIKARQDISFFIITKRIVRFPECIPNDWGNGYLNVSIVCTIENQKQCDTRFPFFNTLPITGKYIACEPLLTDIDMSGYLNPQIRQVLVGGESGNAARICDYRWVLNIRRQCVEKGVKFHFKQTGAMLLKDDKVFRIPRKLQHIQARKAGINT